MFENGNIIPVYSPLVDRLGLGPRLVGRLGFSSTGYCQFHFLMGGMDIGHRRAANVHASQHGGHGPGVVIDFCTSPGWTGNSTYHMVRYCVFNMQSKTDG